MAQSDAELCSRALALCGSDPIATLQDESVEAQTCAQMLPILLEAALADHPWNFATWKWSLNRLTQAPAADWQYAFQLPPDLLRPVAAGIGDTRRPIDYEIVGDQLHCNSDVVLLAGVRKRSVQQLPAFFEFAFIIALAAELCLPLTENTQRTAMLGERAERAIRRARLVDAQMQPGRGVTDLPLLAAHR